MDKNRVPIIAINRQFAAYGRTIAAGLSEKLGIPYYDKDFVKKTAEESGYSLEDVEHESETITRGGKLLHGIMSTSVLAYPDTYNDIFLAQKKVILDLAAEPCIIVGRCADFILRQAKIPCFNVFLYADLEHRRAHAAELEETKGKNLDKYIMRVDQYRRNYYAQYTGKDIDDCRNYDICLDTGSIAPRECVDILYGILKKYQA